MHLNDLHSARAVWRLARHPPIEAPRTKQGRIENLGAVGSAEDDDGLGGLEAVHLGQDLVESLLPLVVCPRYPNRALTRPTDRVELVDEDDRWGGLLGLGEEITDPGRADAHDRLDELRRRDREERGVRLPRDGPCKQSLAGSRTPEQQHAVWDPAAEALVAVGSLQEVALIAILLKRGSCLALGA